MRSALSGYLLADLTFYLLHFLATMCSASYFTPAFKPLIQPDEHRSSKKRERDGISSEDESTNSEVELDSSSRKRGSSIRGTITSRFSSTAVPATVRRETAVQYQAAGQCFDVDIPGPKFPHASRHTATRFASLDTKAIVEDELATLKPPLLRTRLPPFGQWTITGKAENVGLRKKHLENITAVLHRCVLEGDFLRAGRAWGMFLRAEQSGHGMDIRDNDRWGIGAEILLKRNIHSLEGGHGREGTSRLAKNVTANQATGDAGQWFSREGFMNAKDYYERMVLQYPYRKAFPTATSALGFYPAMFGLWLCIVQDEYKTAIKSIEKAARDTVDDRTETSSQESGSPSPLLSPRKHDQMAGIRDGTLQRGDEIASRINELLVSPPYSDDSRLWRLQGMVALWIADLWVVPLPPKADGDFNEGGTPPTLGSEVPGVMVEHIQAKLERDRCVANRQVAISKAKQAFSNAREKGGNRGATMQYFNSL